MAPTGPCKQHFELAKLKVLRSNNFLTRTQDAPFGGLCGKPPTFDSLYIQMDIVSACIFGYTFPAALFFTVQAYVSITPFRTQSAQRGPPFSLIYAHKVGILNEKRCKKCIVEYLYEDS